MKKIDVILFHILEDCNDIQNFIKDESKESFLSNIMLKKAVCMSLINIGELVKSLPKTFCEQHPQLPWKRIAGMRDIAAHKYKQLDMEAMWIVADKRVPEIIDFIKNNTNE
jgi:uncharacterized protein with HEPN domain